MSDERRMDTMDINESYTQVLDKIYTPENLSGLIDDDLKIVYDYQQAKINALAKVLGKALFYMKNNHSYHAGDYNSTCVDSDCLGCVLDNELVSKYGIELQNINESGEFEK